MSRLNFSIKYLLLMLPPFAVLFGLNLALLAFGDPTIELQVTTFADNARALELVGRYRVLTAGAFTIAVSVSILLIFFINMKVGFSPKVWAMALGVVIFGALLGIGITAAAPNPVLDGGVKSLIDAKFFNAALSEGRVSICLAGTVDCAGRGALYIHSWLSKPVDGLVALSVPTVLFGMIVALAAVPKHAMSAQGMTRAHEILQRYLYLSGLQLSAGMIFMNAWMRWPQDIIADAAQRAVYSDLVGALSLYVGMGFSLVILATYLPVMLIIRQRAENLPPVVELGESIQPKNYISGLKTIVAIVSPIIAGAVGGFGSGVSFV